MRFLFQFLMVSAILNGVCNIPSDWLPQAAAGYQGDAKGYIDAHVDAARDGFISKVENFVGG